MVRGRALWFGALTTLVLSYAEGVATEADTTPDGSTGPLTIGGGNGDSGPAGEPDAAADAGPQDGREPCNMGQVGTCTCPDGEESTRDCVFDASSPLDGYYEACPVCDAPDAALDRCADDQKNGAESEALRSPRTRTQRGRGRGAQAPLRFRDRLQGWQQHGEQAPSTVHSKGSSA